MSKCSKEKKTWAVVKFPDEGSVEAVPTSWVYGNKCFWPPYPKAKVRVAIEQQQSPDIQTWQTYDISSFRNNVFDDFNVARRKTLTATVTSDLESCSDTPAYISSKNRRVFQKTLSFSFSEEEVEDSQLPSPPTLKTGSTNLSQIQCDRSRRINYSGIGDSTPDASSDQGTSCTDHQSSLSVIQIKRKRSIKDTDVTVAKQKNTSKEDGNDNDDDDNQIIKYLKRILHKQTILQGMVSDLAQEVEQMKKKFKTTPMDEVDERNSIFVRFNLPINNQEDLNTFEEFLKEKEELKTTMKEISALGGSNTYDFIYRATQRLIINQFATTYSWLGRKGKKVFRDLNLSTLLIKSAMNTVNNCTAKEAELMIQKWLRRCGERAKAENANNN